MPSSPARLAASPATVQEQCYCLNAQRAARRLARLYDQELKAFGLNHGQFALLMMVAGLQPVSLGQVAAEMVMDRTTVTAAVKPLARRGLLETAASAVDQRQRLLRITPAGLALLSEASVAWRRLQAMVQSHQPRASVRTDLQRLAKTSTNPSTRSTARRT